MMTDQHDEDEVLERRFDWAMGEIVQGEQAPDVTASVMARHAAGEIASPKLARDGRRTSYLSAAVLLLGLGVVAWLLWTARTGDSGGGDEAQDRELARVVTLGQIAALPRDTKAVEMRRLGDVGIEALARRCPDLEHLRVRQTSELTIEAGRLLREGLPRLRRIDLTQCATVNDVTVGELIALPSLRRLDLAGTDVCEHSVPLLAAARQIRHIDYGEAGWLTLAMAERMFRGGKRVVCQRPGDAAFERGMRALAMRYADRVDQPYFQQVRTLAEIEALPDNVTHIELRGLGDKALRLAVGRRTFRGFDIIRDDNDAFTSASLRMLSELPDLEELHIGGVQGWHGDGMQHLAKLSKLRVLELSGVPVDDEGLSVLPKLPALTELSLVAVRRISKAGIRSVAACKGLQRLEIVVCEQLVDSDLAPIAALTELRNLSLERTRAGDATVSGLRALTKLERLNLVDCQFSSEAARSLRGLRHLESLKLRNNAAFDTAALIELPVSLRELRLVSCNGLDGAAAPVFRDRFPQLAYLDISSAAWLNDETLATVLETHTLEELSVAGCKNLTKACYPLFRDAPSLRRLNATMSPCMDRALAQQLGEERPDLKVDYKIW